MHLHVLIEQTSWTDEREIAAACFFFVSQTTVQTRGRISLRELHAKHEKDVPRIRSLLLPQVLSIATFASNDVRGKQDRQMLFRDWGSTALPQPDGGNMFPAPPMATLVDLPCPWGVPRNGPAAGEP